MWIRMLVASAVLLVAAPTVHATSDRTSFLGWSPDETYTVSQYVACSTETFELCPTDPAITPTWPVQLAPPSTSCITIPGDSDLHAKVPWGRANFVDDAHKKPAALKPGGGGLKTTLRGGKDGAVTITVTSGKLSATATAAGLLNAKLGATWLARDGRSLVAEVKFSDDGCIPGARFVTVSLAPLGRAATDAEREVRRVLLSQTKLAADRPVLTAFAVDAEVFGPSGTDKRKDAAGFAAMLRAKVERSTRFHVDIARPDIALAADGATAWATFELTMRIDLPEGGTWGTWFGASELLVREKDGWKVKTVMLSHQIDDVNANNWAAGKSVKPRTPVTAGDADEGPPETRAALDAVLAKRGAAFAENISARDEVIALGTAGERIRGGARYRAAMAGYKKPLQLIGHTRGGSIAGGNLIWVVAHLEATAPGKKPYQIPFRVLYAFAKEPAGYKLVLAHWAYLWSGF